jgi:endonuclease/exonuclease/phosphatase family metal-dependent hydrolase
MFYNTDLVYFLPSKDTDILLAGDFNCVLNAADSTGHTQPSRALDTIVRGFDLRDVWNESRPSLGYMHYTPKSASRLDRIYVTRRLFERKQGA